MKPTSNDTAVAVARVRSALLLVVEPGMVVELRILNVMDNPEYPAFTVSGYFGHDHLDEMAKAAMDQGQEGKWLLRHYKPCAARPAGAANRVANSRSFP